MRHPYRRKAQHPKPVPSSAPAEEAGSVPQIPVTDHALLRYLERFEGVDISAVRERLSHRLGTRRTRELIEFSGASSCRVRVDGATFCLRDGRVVTCYP